MDNQNIFKRPNSSDSEADLIKFQNLFLAEKTKNTNFQPAAKVIRLTEPGNEIALFKAVMIYFNVIFLRYFILAESFTIC